MRVIEDVSERTPGTQEYEKLLLRKLRDVQQNAMANQLLEALKHLPMDPDVERDPEKHGLPAVGAKSYPIHPELFVRDPAGRPDHWYDPLNDEVHRLHTNFPRTPKHEPLIIPGQRLELSLTDGHNFLPQPAPVQQKQYVVISPDGEEILVPTKKAAAAVFKAFYGAGLPQEAVDTLADVAVTEREVLAETTAAPSPEEIAEHQRRVREAERAESQEIQQTTAPVVADLAAKLDRAVRKAVASEKPGEVG